MVTNSALKDAPLNSTLFFVFPFWSFGICQDIGIPAAKLFNLSAFLSFCRIERQFPDVVETSNADSLRE
jgi:hypothetical protein